MSCQAKKHVTTWQQVSLTTDQKHVRERKDAQSMPKGGTCPDLIENSPNHNMLQNCSKIKNIYTLKHGLTLLCQDSHN
jgi:hypothetical protein